MEILFGAILLVLVAAFVLRPLYREAGKEAKYREIRDAQLDHAAGKLSDQDFERLDAELRGEAIAILEELDRAKPSSGTPAP